MKCRINYQTDPNSLTIIAADGQEHQFLDRVGHDGLLEVKINLMPRVKELERVLKQLLTNSNTSVHQRGIITGVFRGGNGADEDI